MYIASSDGCKLFLAFCGFASSDNIAFANFSSSSDACFGDIALANFSSSSDNCKLSFACGHDDLPYRIRTREDLDVSGPSVRRPGVSTVEHSGSMDIASSGILRQFESSGASRDDGDDDTSGIMPVDDGDGSYD